MAAENIPSEKQQQWLGWTGLLENSEKSLVVSILLYDCKTQTLWSGEYRHLKTMLQEAVLNHFHETHDTTL